MSDLTLGDAAQSWNTQLTRAVGTHDTVTVAELLTELTAVLKIFGGGIRLIVVRRGYSDESDTSRAERSLMTAARLLEESRE